MNESEPVRIPPLNVNDPETRLLRAIYGYCPDCDHERESHYDGPDDGQTHHCRECEA